MLGKRLAGCQRIRTYRRRHSETKRSQAGKITQCKLAANRHVVVTRNQWTNNGAILQSHATGAARATQLETTEECPRGGTTTESTTQPEESPRSASLRTRSQVRCSVRSSASSRGLRQPKLEQEPKGMSALL